MINLDLFPGVFYNIAIRMLLACFVSMLVWYFWLSLQDVAVDSVGYVGDVANRVSDSSFVEALSQGTTPKDPTIGSFFAPVLGFMVGMFPTQWFQQLVDRVDERFRRTGAGDTVATFGMSGDKKADAEKIRRACRLPLEMIQGMNTFHKARLNELGIDNCQNLAKSHVLEILLRTPFQAELVVDWIGQALLIVHFRDEIDSLRQAGVRTVFDLTSLDRDGDGPESLHDLHVVSNVQPEKLRIIHRVLCRDSRLTELANTRDALRPAPREHAAEATAATVRKFG